MIQFRENCKRNYFGSIFGQFWPFWANKIFFSKIRLRHFLSWPTLGPHVKNQKNPMIQFTHTLHTNTGEFIGPLLYEVGPKNICTFGKLPPSSPHTLILIKDGSYNHMNTEYRIENT